MKYVIKEGYSFRSGERCRRDCMGIGIPGLVERVVLSWIKVVQALAEAIMVGG